MNEHRKKLEQIKDLVDRFDLIIGDALEDMEPHNIAAILLSRATHLLADDPGVGKGLVRVVWEQLDQIEQEKPGDII